MRKDDDCIREMLAALEQLLELRRNPEAERLLVENRSFRHSVFFEFVVIGEEVARLSEGLRERHPIIPWQRISSFRHRVAHAYFGLSLPFVLQLWTDEVPRLRAQLLAILAADFPEMDSHGPQD